MLTFHLITLFPGAFRSYLLTSIIGRAIQQKKIAVRFLDPRDFAEVRGRSRRRQIDGRPFGGGPGMVLRALPVLKAVQNVKSGVKRQRSKIILFSPRGKQFTNALAASWARKFRHLIIICGRYEGVDARVKKILKAEEISIGPFVLNGGEVPALAVLEAVSRQLPGVLGKDESVEERRVTSGEVYTRPDVLVYRGRKYRVPKVLLSGHHAQIEEWKTRS